MHALNDISTIVKDSSNVLSIYGTGEVRIAVVCTVLLRVGSTRLLADLKEIIPEKKIYKNVKNLKKC